MKTNKITNLYIYKSNASGTPPKEVGFYIEQRKNEKGFILKKLNVFDEFGDIKQIDYSGKTLMISIKPNSKTVCVRAATREDLEVKYPEAFALFKEHCSPEIKKELETKLYSFLSEVPPVKAEPKKNTDKSEENKE